MNGLSSHDPLLGQFSGRLAGRPSTRINQNIPFVWQQARQPRGDGSGNWVVEPLSVVASADEWTLKEIVWFIVYKVRKVSVFRLGNGWPKSGNVEASQEGIIED